MRETGKTPPLNFPLLRCESIALAGPPRHLAPMDGLRLLVSKVRRLLAYRGRSADDIDDLMQEAFLRLQAYRRDHVVENTEAFLVRTTLNLSAEQNRRARVRGGVVADPAQVLSIVDPTPTPEEVYAGQQRLRRARAGLNRLSARSRQVFLMHRVDGLSYAQIAEELQISVSMVEKHIARASFFMRDWMARSRE